MTDSDFWGKGIKFPLEITDDGVLAWSEGEDLIRQSINLILSTAPGERIMRPDFGCGLNELAFAVNNVTTHSRVSFAVEEALKKWEPRIHLEEVDVQSDSIDPAKLNIQIHYTILSNNSRYNMVFPFYLEKE